MMRASYTLALLGAGVVIAASVDCMGENCTVGLFYRSAADGELIPDTAVDGAACTLAVTSGDASVVIDIAADDGGSVRVPCTAPSLPTDTFLCSWGSVTNGFDALSVDTRDVDAGAQVNAALGHPDPTKPALATLTCKGAVVPGASTRAFLQTCGI